MASAGRSRGSRHGPDRASASLRIPIPGRACFLSPTVRPRIRLALGIFVRYGRLPLAPDLFGSSNDAPDVAPRHDANAVRATFFPSEVSRRSLAGRRHVSRGVLMLLDRQVALYPSRATTCDPSEAQREGTAEACAVRYSLVGIEGIARSAPTGFLSAP